MPKTKTPSNGKVVSGRIRWRVRIQGTTPSRVDLAIDGRVVNRRSRRSVRRTLAETIDTTKLSNGRHTLTAFAYRARGRLSGKTRVRVRVANSPASSLYWGASIGPQLTGTQAPWDMSAVSRFEGLVGKPLSLVHFYSPFANCATSPCSFYGFPTGAMENVREHGAIPFFSWGSQSTPSSLNEPDFQLSDVIAGTYDQYLRSFATAARSWGHPFFLRFNFEMNGDWFPWSEGVNGNQPGEYVAAWRHVHDIFASVGASNATWVWCPNVDPGGRLHDLRSLYPGDGYVDWTCLDGYSWGTNPSAPRGWMSFDRLFRSTYDQIVDTIAPGKPMIIGETAASEYGGSKADWITDMLSELPASYPKIHGVLWFERVQDGMDWPIETSGAATRAFANRIQSPAYKVNDYAGLAAGPIPVPG